MKLKAIITGEVHGVGYRVLLTNMALEYGIDNFSAFNLTKNGEKTVICLLDAPDDVVEELKERIRTERPERAIVDSIEFKDYAYYVPPTERTIQTFQMEHWGKAIPILQNISDIQEKMLGNQGKMLDKQDTAISNQEKMLGNQGKMLDKQDTAISNQERMLGNQDTMIGNQGKMIGNQEKMLGNQGRMISNQESMIGNQSTIIGNQDRMLDKQDTAISNQERMLVNQDTMIGNQTKMIDRQDTTVSEIRRAREELKTKVEEVNCSVREGFEGNGEKIDSLRDDLKHMDPA